MHELLAVHSIFLLWNLPCQDAIYLARLCADCVEFAAMSESNDLNNGLGDCGTKKCVTAIRDRQVFMMGARTAKSAAGSCTQLQQHCPGIPCATQIYTLHVLRFPRPLAKLN